MTGSRLILAGPSVYGLTADSDVGGERYERELMCRLPAQGIQVLLGMPRSHGLEPASGVRPVVLPRPAALHWMWAPLLFVPWTAALLRGRRIDVLWGPSVRYVGPSLLWARDLCRSRAPVVILHHHFEPRWRWLEAAILRRADMVMTVSDHSRQQLVEAGVASERIRIARNGISAPPLSTPEPPATWPANGLRLLYLGRLEARKRPGLAIETLADLTRRGHAAALVLAGEGPELMALKARARDLGVADRVRFLGRVAEERKWQLYDGADLLLFGSTLEGFGLVVAEAQSRGLPVIAAAGTATAEALQEGRSGLLVAPDSVAFSQAVQSVLGPARREQMGVAAREFARRFTWDACAAATASALRESMSAREARP
jgi:glycosyltransferase involved in cell wall biosynthesis